MNLNMEVRGACKLPPLPNRKNPINPDKNNSPSVPNRPPVSNRISSFSREKTQKRIEQRVASMKRIRPSSVRPTSRDSIHSRDSRNSRDSSRDRSIELSKDKITHSVKMRISMPSVTARSWAVYEMKQAKMIYGKRTFKKREMASLTKIMNFITILDLLKQHNIEPAKVKVQVSRQASCINGTTAELKQGMTISLWNLYFGMMLPSGNDAAFQIAQIGGSILILEKLNEQARRSIILKCDKLTEFIQTHPQCVKIYLAQMNKVSKKLGMQNSHFANPHGLSNPDNYSCAQDLCRLCTYSMENDNFRHVVSTQFHNGYYKYFQTGPVDVCLDMTGELGEIEGEERERQQRQGQNRVLVQKEGVLKWQNTNKMLKQGWSGIKTGITPNAGPCLAASVCKFINGRSLEFLVILICSKSMDQRWREVKQIVDWVIQQQIYF